MMTKKPRIAIVSPSLNATAGGVEKFSSMLAEVISNDDLEVRIFTPRPASSRILAKFGLSQLQQSLSMRDELIRWSPQLVITNGTMGFLGFKPTSWQRIHVFHGTMVGHSLADRNRRSYKDWLIKGVVGGGLSEALSGLGAMRVAVSNACASEVRKFYLMNAQHVIPNGVRLASPASGERQGLIFVGRRESRKGYDLAVELAQGVNQTLAVAGPGSDPRTLDLGVLGEHKLQELYGRSRAMIFPSNYEACSLAVLEALANGCAVVTTAVGWVPELLAAVPDYKRLVGTRNDASSFRQPIERVLNGDAATMAALKQATEWTRQNNSFDRFQEKWSALVLRQLAHHEFDLKK